MLAKNGSDPILKEAVSLQLQMLKCKFVFSVPAGNQCFAGQGQTWHRRWNQIVRLRPDHQHYLRNHQRPRLLLINDNFRYFSLPFLLFRMLLSIVSAFQGP